MYLLLATLPTQPLLALPASFCLSLPLPVPPELSLVNPWINPQAVTMASWIF